MFLIGINISNSFNNLCSLSETLDFDQFKTLEWKLKGSVAKYYERGWTLYVGLFMYYAKSVRVASLITMKWQNLIFWLFKDN